MEQMLLIALIVLIIAVSFYLVINRIIGNNNQSNKSVELLKTDLIELSRSVNQLQSSINDQLDKNNLKIQNSLQNQLNESVNIVKDVTHKLTMLDETNKRVIGVADELKTLQNVFLNPKQRGVFGEYYLQSILENVMSPKQFKIQYKYKDNLIVDAVILLDKDKILPVDSKFSLENYNRLIEANSKDEKEKYLKKIKIDLKNRIDETSKYIQKNENTMDFAFMFIPSESLYHDLLNNTIGQGISSRDLIEYAFQDKHVIIVSPTSFMAYLQTVLQGLRSLKIEKQAKEIQIKVGKLSTHIIKFEEYMAKLGQSLSTTVNKYNTAHQELGKIDKDILKISDENSNVSPLRIDGPSQDN